MGHPDRGTCAEEFCERDAVGTYYCSDHLTWDREKLLYELAKVTTERDSVRKLLREAYCYEWGEPGAYPASDEEERSVWSDVRKALLSERSDSGEKT